MPKTTEHRI